MCRKRTKREHNPRKTQIGRFPHTEITPRDSANGKQKSEHAKYPTDKISYFCHTERRLPFRRKPTKS